MVVTIAYTGLRWGETIGLEREYLAPRRDSTSSGSSVSFGSAFHRLPPKDDSYRSPAWEPCLPVDLPPFLAGLLARQVQGQPRNPCACATQHGGTGRYVFLGPDGGHYRRSNYARRVFRPACDGRFEPAPSRPARLVIADATVWPGVPVAMWPPAQPGDRQLHPADADEASRPSRRAPRSPAGSRSGPASPRTAYATATRPGWPRTASPRSWPSSGWATRCPACAACTPTPRTGCATTSTIAARGPLGGLAARPRSHPHPLTRPAARRIAWPGFAREPAKNQSQQHQREGPVRQPTALGDREKMISQIPPNHARKPQPRN